jgi:hypothetical protein
MPNVHIHTILVQAQRRRATTTVSSYSLSYSRGDVSNCNEGANDIFPLPGGILDAEQHRPQNPSEQEPRGRHSRSLPTHYLHDRQCDRCRHIWHPTSPCMELRFSDDSRETHLANRSHSGCCSPCSGAGRRSSFQFLLQTESETGDDKPSRPFSQQVFEYRFKDSLDFCSTLFAGTGLHDCGGVPEFVLFASAYLQNDVVFIRATFRLAVL